MANIVFKVGTLDLSSFIRVNPDEHLDLGQGDMLDPAFSDSPFYEGQVLTSVHAKNKELKVPLFLHPPTAPYTNDALNQLVQQVNQAMRPINDLGITVYAEWKNAQAVNSTFFSIQFGRFEPDFNFRITEKGWLAGTLHLWVLPYGHTATERIVATAAAPVNQSGMQLLPSAILQGALKSGPSNLITAQNIVPNPGFQYGATGWQLGFGPLFAAASYGVITDGASPALRYITDGNHNAEGVAATIGFPLAPGNYFVAFQARASAGADTISVVAEDYTTGLNGQLAQSFAVGTAYAQYGATWAVTGTIPAPGIFFSKQASGVSMQMIRNVMVTKAGGPTSYFDGDGASCAWEGVAGNSISDLLTFGQSLQGDVPPQMDLRMTVGSYLGNDGRLGIISALPIASYNPIVPVGSFIGLSASAIIQGASGAWASQYLAIDAQAAAGATGAVGNFSFALSPGSVYQGDNRVIGLVRGRFTPFGLRAFDPRGNPLGPTVIASAMDGWQVVDLGVLRVPPWMPTVSVNVQAYPGIEYTASGMFAPRRAAQTWTKEIGPVFVLPNQSTILDLDWDSPIISFDGFDGASGGNLAQDALGNSWQFQTGGAFYSGNSQLNCNGASQLLSLIGTTFGQNDFQSEAIFTFPTASAAYAALIYGVQSTPNSISDTPAAIIRSAPSGAWLNVAGNTTASVSIPSFLAGQYHLILQSRASVFSAILYGPSGAFAGSASGAALIATSSTPTILALPPAVTPPQPWQLGLQVGWGAASLTGTVAIEAYRARTLASQGQRSRDILHLHQPLVQNTRMSPSSIDVTDLQSRQRGAVQAPQPPVPSLGAGLFIASFPWDQGPANDLLNVDIRLRERFTYAR